MSLTARLTPTARRVLARAGTLATDHPAGGRRRVLDDATLLAALAAEATVAPLLGGAAARLRDGVRAGAGRGAADLLATLGIDLHRVRDGVASATGYRVDDPQWWRLSRPPLLPLRLRLIGPPGVLVLTEPARKAVEVAVNGAPRGAAVGERDLLRGLLADRRTPAVRAMVAARVDLWSLVCALRGPRAA